VIFNELENMMTKVPFDLNYEKLLKPSREMSQVAVDNAKEIARINQQAAQEMAVAFQEKVAELLKGQDPRSAFDYVQAEVLQDAAKKVLEYQTQIAEVFKEGNQEMARLTELMIKQSKEDLIHFVNEATANAPAGSEGYASVFKSAFNTALKNFELIRSATAESFDKFEKSVQNVSNLSTMEKASPRKTTARKTAAKKTSRR
jgi:hypothetical protein